ncbi:restriction endonuclease subunit S [Pseudogracilibacillus sp. SO30301A]|uniref:restriction endonuclease subunit S n=1 Tax=Pseudogracilibacillus sp. SO30301A TaxID=3098291 RepID=UPI00300E0A4C
MKYISILDVCDLNDKTVKEYEGVKRYVATGDVSNGKIVSFSDVNYIKKPSRANRMVEKGEILLAKMKETEKVLLIDEKNEDYIYSTGFFTLKPDTNKVNAEYIYYVLKSKYFQNEKDKLAKGATQKALNNAGFKKIKIPVPSKSMQEQITEALKTTELILIMRQQQIEAFQTLKQSIFLDMFGDPNSNPKRWKEDVLGNYLLNIKGGWSPKCHSREIVGDEWGVLKLSAITQGNYNFEFNKALPQNIDPKVELEVRNNDLLFNRKNTPELVGTTAFVFRTRKNLIFPDTIFRLELKEGLNKVFLWQLLSNPSTRKKIKQLASGSAKSMSNISQKNLKQLKIIIPNLTYQEQYANIVQQIEEQINVLSEGMNQMNMLYDSILHKAFSGELFKEDNLKVCN